jgi:hypothetical protein
MRDLPERRIANSAQPSPLNSLRDAVQPISGGSAPGIAPTKVFIHVTRLSGV